MKQANATRMLGRKFDVISEVVLLLYNWYKSKQICTIEDEMIYSEDVRIDREKLKLFPYSGLYLDLEFYSLDYVGCFITLTREPCGVSLRRYMLIGFVEYKKKMDVYAIEPFMLELQDGIKVEDAFINKYESNTNNKGTGSSKAPHTRRTHNRHLPIKDDEGNIIGEKVITIKELRIHAEQESKITVRKL